MEWLFLTVVLLLIVYHRTFRKVAFVLALLAVLGVLGLGAQQWYARHQAQAQAEANRLARLKEVEAEIARREAMPPASVRDWNQELFGTPALPDLPDKPPQSGIPVVKPAKKRY